MISGPGKKKHIKSTGSQYTTVSDIFHYFSKTNTHTSRFRPILCIMGSLGTTNGVSNGVSNGIKGRNRKWGFDTLQIHAGLEESPRYGHITLPIYNTASFKFTEVDHLNHALEDISSSQNHLYTRVSNVSFLPWRQKELSYLLSLKHYSPLTTVLRNELPLLKTALKRSHIPQAQPLSMESSSLW